jgi:hypothetical protein
MLDTGVLAIGCRRGNFPASGIAQNSRSSIWFVHWFQCIPFLGLLQRTIAFLSSLDRNVP